MFNTYHSWPFASEKISFSRNDIHIWCAALDSSSFSMHKFEKMLSTEERTKADRFHLARDRKSFIVGRGVLRNIIGNDYLDTDPEQLKFYHGLRGKAYLAEGIGDGKPQFNKADSRGLALYAFSMEHDVGIDIEYMRDMADAQQIVDGSFSEAEKEAFGALLERQKQEAFFNCWTRKEAYIKAI